LKPKCYFCDSELEVVLHTFRVMPREEPVCEECYTKMTNHKKTRAEESKR
jgi:transposase-like protein